MPIARALPPLLACLLLAGPALAAGSKFDSDPAPGSKADLGAPLNECDTLAQPPRAAFGPLPALADGVALASLRWPAARPACAKAMSDFPGEVRFVAYAGRAAEKAGDLREAARLYKAAADEGNPVAQNNLGAMYGRGEGGLPRNPREAERYYRLAADQGYPVAQTNLGALYALGGGVPRNDREAVRLWQLAADAGEAGAQANLGTMYAEGRGGLPRDMNQAVRMWRAAADAGNAEAQGNLRKAGRY